MNIKESESTAKKAQISKMLELGFIWSDIKAILKCSLTTISKVAKDKEKYNNRSIENYDN